ncbi:LacI family DNA-binding transcriptional regulator [Blastococcus tunisiensis]|uniref:DNA-binding transcriptional regulator, LacI/PurR family n=1 Tax=Blastococcus tunisiensis TaxID=1798228 RepID=A0A1I2G618_9ACTN|nr:LacI family DNA-binding transcriptional regulator [Blastococcus sp. DSM 46838]SFF12440.1 DNA-binding transcriptional regulator, LacI/PurR family [Blastococcus sp. DSM 46838]
MSSTAARPGTPTLDQVASLAGVSRATVSRVVNDSPRVSPTAREAVRAAVETLRYVPNRAARSLVTRRTDTVALVLSESGTQLFSDPFFASIVQGLSAHLADTDRTLVLLAARDRREQEKIGRYARQGHVDGVILLSLHSDDLLPGILASSRVPLVLSGRPLDGREVSYVDADNAGGAAAATRHLLAQGRTRIATITGPLDMVAGLDRYAGYRSALEAAGRTPDPDLVDGGDFGEVGGMRAMSRLLDRAPDLDAVFVASDPMAAGALQALRTAGRRVPDDVALVGFDDAPLAQACDPPLTTVAQPLGEMTALMLELLLRRIEDADAPVETRVCATHLVRRASA